MVSTFTQGGCASTETVCQNATQNDKMEGVHAQRLCVRTLIQNDKMEGVQAQRLCVRTLTQNDNMEGVHADTHTEIM